MSEAGKVRGVINQHGARLRNIYASTCGDADAYPLVKDAFIESLDGPTLAILTNGNGNSVPVESFFRQFLGNGEGCHETSFLHTVRKETSTIQNGSTAVIRYELWREFLGKYTDSLEDLPFQFDNIRATDAINIASRRNIISSSRRIEIIMSEIERILNGYLEKDEDPNIHDEIIIAQMEMVYGLKYSIERVMDTIEPLPKIQITFLKNWRDQQEMQNNNLIMDPQVNRWLLKKAWREFTNPLHWIYEVYVDRLNKKNLGVQVQFDKEIPHVTFWNPQLINGVIDQIVLVAEKYGNLQKPVTLKMSWNMNSHILSIVTRDAMRLIQDTDWKGVQGSLNKLRAFWGVDNINSTISIHLPVLDVSENDPSSNRNNGIPPPPTFENNPPASPLTGIKSFASIPHTASSPIYAARNTHLITGAGVFNRLPALTKPFPTAYRPPPLTFSCP